MASQQAMKRNSALDKASVALATNRAIFSRGARDGKVAKLRSEPREKTPEQTPRTSKVKLEEPRKSKKSLVHANAGIDALQAALLEHNLEWAITDKDDPRQPRLPEKVQELSDMIQHGVHVLKTEEGIISLQSAHFYIQIVYDSRALVITHERLPHQMAKLVTKLPFTVRNMHLSIQQGVERWFMKELGLEWDAVSNGVRLTGIRQVSVSEVESENFPGIMEVHKSDLAIVTVNSEVHELMRRLGLPECHPMGWTQNRNGRDVDLLCSWLPEQLCPCPLPSSSLSVIKDFAASADTRKQCASELLKGYLCLEPDAFSAVIWNPPGADDAMLIAIAPPADRLFGEPYYLAHILFRDGVDQHGELTDRYSKMQHILRSDCARLVRIHKSEDKAGRGSLFDTGSPRQSSSARLSQTSKQVSGTVVELALDKACWDAPEVAAGLRISVAVLEDVLRTHVINLVDHHTGVEIPAPTITERRGSIDSDPATEEPMMAASGCTGQASGSKCPSRTASPDGNFLSENTGHSGPNVLLSALTRKLPCIIKHMAGPSGILSKLSSHPERKQHSILDIHQPILSLARHATKRNPGLIGLEHYNPFNPPLDSLLGQIDVSQHDGDPEKADPEKADPVSRTTVSKALDVLKQLHVKFQLMQDSHKWRKDCWRPLGCMAHGELSFSNVLVDGLASVWLYNCHSAGVKPVWSDVADLSISMLVDGCILPISFEHLVLLISEMEATVEDLAQWLKVGPLVAEVLLSECAATAENKKALEEDVAMTKKESSRRFGSRRDGSRKKTRKSTLHEALVVQQNISPSTNQDPPAKQGDSSSSSRKTLVRAKTPETHSDSETDSAAPRPSESFSRSRTLGTLSKIRELEDDKAMNSFKVLRILKKAAEADPSRPPSEVLQVLQAQITANTTEAHSCLEEHYEFANAWVAHLAVRKYTSDMEAPKLTGHLKELWDLQMQLLEEAVASYSSVVRQLPNMTPSIKVLPVDTSPILIELPLLDGALKYLSSPSVAPWRKNFVCSLVTALGNRILQEAKTMEAPPVSEAPLPPPKQQGKGVQFAPGHRMLMGIDSPNDDPKFFTGQVIPITVGEGAAKFGKCVPWGDVSLDGPMACLGWPCSGYGMTISDFCDMRKDAEVDNPDVNIRHQYEIATRTQLTVASPYAVRLRKQPWPDEFSSNACSGCFQVLGVEYDKEAVGELVYNQEKVCVEDVGVGLLLKNVQRDELLVHGRRVGWAAVGQCLVMDCPRGCAHAKATLQMPLNVYDRFPCTGCGRIMNLSEAGTSSPMRPSPCPSPSSSPRRPRDPWRSPLPSPRRERSPEAPDPTCVHCPECWANQKRFDLCGDCVRTRVPLCLRGHDMENMTSSPYDGEPHCRRCQKKIPPFTAWDEPPSTKKQDMEVPRWYHCRQCHQEHNPPFDLCVDCAYVICPQGHKMNVLNRTRSGLMGKCHHCGKGGGVFNVLHCITCQDMRTEVVYPSVDAARLDFQLSASKQQSKTAGLAVTGVKRGGAAALAGVQTGHRLVAFNKRQVKGPVEFAFVGARGAVLAEFASPLISVVYEDAKEILKDMTLQKSDHALMVVKVSFGGRAVQAGVSRGCRLVSINDKTMEKLRWDGKTPLSSAPPFYCAFQARGTELIYHEGCGISCDHGHFMEPQYPPFVRCQEGHPMERKLKSALKLTENECCDFCDQVLLEDPNPSIMYCGQCTRPVDTTKSARRRSYAQEKLTKKERCTLPALKTVSTAVPAHIAGQSQNLLTPGRDGASGAADSASDRLASSTMSGSSAGSTPTGSPRVSNAPPVEELQGERATVAGIAQMLVRSKQASDISRPHSQAATLPTQVSTMPEMPSLHPLQGRSKRTSFGSRSKGSIGGSSSSDSLPDVADIDKLIGGRSMSPQPPREGVCPGPKGRPRRSSLPNIFGSNALGATRRNSFASGPSTALIAATHQKRMLCMDCAESKHAAHKTRIPYFREGTVQCSDCGRTDVGRPKHPKEKCPNIPFFHCKECYDSETSSRFDVCMDCVGHHLRCDNEHLMVQCSESPYLRELQCAGCERDLPLDGRHYHCDTCWWQDGVQLDRCAKCAERTKVEVALDETARFQLLSKDAPLDNLVWASSIAPFAKMFAAGVHLIIRLQLRGFVYPPFTRLQILTDDREREATVCGPPLANGKYEIHLDGDSEPIMLDPDLTNHIPAAVYRYSPGQKLSVYTSEHGWLDVLVLSVTPEGNGHLVTLAEAISIHESPDAQEQWKPWHVMLNTWNHTPLWLDHAQWISQRRIWDEHLLVTCSGAADVTTGRRVDIMSLMWNLRAADSEANMFTWLLTLVSRSSERHRGMHRNAGVAILGPQSCGKSCILKRLVIECIKDPVHEIVPLLIDVIDMVQTMGGAEKCLFRLKQLCFFDSYLSAAYGAGTKQYSFLLQALYAKRALILIDGFEKLGKEAELPQAILAHLEKLRAAGHRIVVPIPLDGKEAHSSKRFPAVGVPKDFQCLWVERYDSEQQHYLAEKLLGELVAKPFLKSLNEYQVDVGELVSTPMMFHLFLNTAKVKSSEHRAAFEKRLEERRQKEQARLEQEAAEAEQAKSVGVARKAAEATLASTLRNSLQPNAEITPRPESPNSSSTSGGDKSDEEEEFVEWAVPFEDNVSEALANIINRTFRSLASGDAHQAAHLQNLFEALALKLLQSGSQNFNEKDVVELSRADSRQFEAWQSVEDIIQRDRFSMVSTADTLNKRGRLQHAFRFTHPCIQHSLVSSFLIHRWGQMSSPLKSMEQALTERVWEPAIRWMAPLLKGPMTVKMIECVEEHAVLLQNFVSRSNAVNNLSYSATNVGQCWKTLGHVCNACRQNSALAHLDLNLCGLGSTGVRTLCTAIQNHPRLEILHLKDNHLGLIGAQFVSEMLCVNRSIRTLDLSINTIGDMGVYALSDALVENQVVGSLNLQQNNISTDACKSLNSSVQLTSIYRVVDTRYNRKDVPDFFISVAAGGPDPRVSGLNPEGSRSPRRPKSSSPTSPKKAEDFLISSARGSPKRRNTVAINAELDSNPRSSVRKSVADSNFRNSVRKSVSIKSVEVEESPV